MLEYLASSIARDMLIIIGLGIATNVGKQIKYKIQKRGRQTMMEIALLFRIGSTVSLALLTGAVVIYKKSKKRK